MYECCQHCCRGLRGGGSTCQCADHTPHTANQIGLHGCRRRKNANMYCDILKQGIIPSLRRLGHRAVIQHDNDPKHTSKMTTALLKKLRVKVICVASSNRMWTIDQLRDVVMEEWKRTPVVTCEALVNSMRKRVKAVLENNGGHTKY